jgi:hypothetical protein
MTDRADPCWAEAAGPSPAVRAALALPPPLPHPPLADALSADLPPAPLPVPPALDLSPRERHALAAALGPDLCLCDCPPGTDRLGFAATVAVEAVRRGERVAVVTASAADADAVLARLLDADLTVGRACGPGEVADPDHGFAAHAAEVEVLRRRLADHLDRKRADAATANATAAALPRLHELADELARLAEATKSPPAPAAKPGGLLGAVKGWFHKPTPSADTPPPADPHQRQAEVLEQFRVAGQPLTAAGLPSPTPDGLAQTAAAVADAQAATSTAVTAAAEVLAKFDADHPTLVRGLCRAVPVAVGPLAALADPLLSSADRLVVVSADHADDAALSAAAAVAPARVLLGTAHPPRPHRNGKSGSFARASLFRRLWDRHATPEVWALDGVQLVATLRPHDPADTRDEPLADRPDVELRFTPAGDLAAVAFGPTLTLAEAKSLLGCELGWAAVAGCGGHAWHADRLEVCWPALDGDGDWADLGDGVRELVAGTGPDGLTAAVSFDRSHGWTRATAEAWLAERLAPTRAVRLPAPVLVAG